MNDVEEWTDEDRYQQYKACQEDARDGKTYQGKTPRQQAQHLKQKRFNNVLNDLGLNKDYALANVRYSDTRAAESVYDIHRVLRSFEQRSLNL